MPKNPRKNKSTNEIFSTGSVVPNSKKIKTNKSEANFEIECKNDSKLEITESEMEHDYFEDNPIDDDTSIDAYSKWTVAETNVSEVKASEIKSDISKNKTPKPIMVK